MRQQYLITAGINKYGRQMYLNGYVDDETAWDISAVPVPMSKSKCNQIIKQAEKDIIKISEKFPRKYMGLTSFEIIPYEEKLFTNIVDN